MSREEEFCQIFLSVRFSAFYSMLL